jgi:hypothetical protein
MGVTLPRAWIFSACLVACGTGGAPQVRAPERQVVAPAAKPAANAVAAPVTEQPAAPAADAAPAAEPSEDASLTREIPTTCSGSEGCYPHPAFVERLCRGKFPALPLALFAKSAPWQHRFVQAISADPENTYGGPRSNAPMNFGEEVVVLRKRGPGGGRGVQISGPTDLDVLRWDGTCATVREELFVSYNQGRMASPHIVWKYLEDPLQEALRKSAPIERAQLVERKNCRDSSPTKPTPACDKAMTKLTETIIVAVRMGLELPAPESAPEWRRADPTASR